MRNASNTLAPLQMSRRYGRPTKLQQVMGDLSALAHSLGPGEKLPTVRDLQARLGTTSATLSSAMTRLEADGVIRREHGVGVFVSPHLHRQTVVLICNPAVFCGPGASPFWGALIERAQERADDLPVSFSLHFSLPSGGGMAPEGATGLHPNLQADLEAGRISGVLAVGLPSPTIQWLRRCRTALVCFAGPPSDWNVGQDSDELLRLAIDALTEQGCRRIGLWQLFQPVHGNLAEYSTGDSTEWFRRGLEARGLTFDPHLVEDNYHLLGHYLDSQAVPRHKGADIPIIETGHQQGYRTALRVFCGDGERPDGVVVMDDVMTAGALHGLREAGVRVGRDVKIATHYNRGASAFLDCHEGLTFVEFDLGSLVTALFDTLETLMDGRTPPSATVWVRPQIRR